MKHLMKRTVSLLLLLSLVAALLAGVTFQASAKNNDHRGTLCTSLSAKAKAYYTGSYAYDKMSALSGGSTDCVTSMDSALYKSLKSLMSSTQTNQVSYKSLTKYWPTTDNNILFYADQTGSGYNREHVWPKSRASFYQKNGGCDLHHLRPANQTVNSTRSNYTMGYVNGVINGCSTYQYGGRTVLWYSAGNDLVEVRDNVKGDVARILLYVYCRWGQPNLYQNVKAENLPALDSDDDKDNGLKVIESLDTLLKWCKSDPVDTWEMTRNDETQTIQGNRNVFIDYPEYAWLVFGQDIPNDMQTPSGEAAHAAPACDHAWDDGVVTTEPTCTEKGVKTYTCSKCSKTKTEELPALGHIDENKDSLCDRCGAKLGEDLKPAGNQYVKAASLKDGDEVVLYNAGNGKALAGEMSSYYVAGVDVTPANGKITDPDAKLVWKVKKNSDGSFTFTQDGGNILGTDSRENNGKTYYNLYVNGEHKSTWTVEVANAETSANYIYSSAMTGSYGKIYVEWYADKAAFSAYDTSTDRVTEKDFGFQFYVKTDDAPHVHTWDEGVVTTEPTCTEKGVKTYTCTVCKETKTEELAALGHIDENKDNLCDRCGAKLSEDPKPTYSDFTDLDSNGWYRDGINYMIENGMMNGVGDGMFEPNGNVTRAMLVTILYRQAGSPSVEGKTNPFIDVKPNKYYTNAVIWAFHNGIVNGVSPTEFEPESNVTREQIATILYRQAGSPAVTETDLSRFLDASDVSSYAANAVRWAVSEGVIKGSKIGTVADVYAAVIDELSPVHATGFEDIDGDGIKELFVQVKIDDIYYQMLFDICGDELKCVSVIQRTEDSAAFYSLSYTGVLYCTLLNYNEGFEIYRLDRASDDSYQPTLVASYISYGAYCEKEYQQTIASLGLYRENIINLYYNNTIPYELRQAELIALFPKDTATRAEISTMLMRYLTK